MTSFQDAQRPTVVHVIREPAASPTNYDDYKWRASRILGAILIVIGCIVIVTVSVSTTTALEETNQDFSPVGPSVFFIVTGSFLIAASFKKNPCFIVTAMILSILSAIGMSTVLNWGIRMTVEAVDFESYDYDGCGCFDQWDDVANSTFTICADCVAESEEGHCGGIVMGSIVITVAVAALVVSIVASTLGCQIFCCGKRQGQVHQVGFGVPYNYTTQQVLIQSGAAPQYQPSLPAEAEKQPLDGPAVMQVSSIPQLPPAYTA